MPAGHGGLWVLFAITIVVLLAVDLGLVNRRMQQPSVRQAARWSATVVAAALAFAAIVWLREGRTNGVLFATGYVVEFSLSVDNLLVFIVLLRYFSVPPALHSTVLKWGIIGAIAMRGMMIALGTLLVSRFGWVLYLFGALLIVTGLRMLLRSGDDTVSVERNPVTRIARRLLPFTDRFHDGAFVIRAQGRRFATPLLLVLLVIEWTDLVFATDSIPAIFAITRDPFLVYTSNIFAIVGLRALFFVLAGAIVQFVYLRHGVALVLVLVGVKMLIVEWVTVPPGAALAGVVGILAIAVAASLRHGQGPKARAAN